MAQKDSAEFKPKSGGKPLAEIKDETQFISTPNG